MLVFHQIIACMRESLQVLERGLMCTPRRRNLWIFIAENGLTW